MYIFTSVMHRESMQVKPMGKPTTLAMYYVKRLDISHGQSIITACNTQWLLSVMSRKKLYIENWKKLVLIRR